MRRICIGLFFWLILCASVFAQNRAVIQCDRTVDRVPAWTDTGRLYLFRYLSCGETVNVTGRDGGFVRLLIDGYVAYVDAKYVRVMPARGPQPLPPLPPPPPPPPRSYEPATPAAEVFVGYSYLNFNTNGLTTSRKSANGWEASVSGNLNRWFALELDVSGYYKNYSYYTGSSAGLPNFVTISYYRDYSYLAGPRLNYAPVFVHALFGGDHLSGSALGTSAAQTGFAGALGGGIQVPMSDRFAFRVGADYVFSQHNIFGAPSITNNNFRASVGIVFNLGSR